MAVGTCNTLCRLLKDNNAFLRSLRCQNTETVGALQAGPICQIFARQKSVGVLRNSGAQTGTTIGIAYQLTVKASSVLCCVAQLRTLFNLIALQVKFDGQFVLFNVWSSRVIGLASIMQSKSLEDVTSPMSGRDKKDLQAYAEQGHKTVHFGTSLMRNFICCTTESKAMWCSS